MSTLTEAAIFSKKASIWVVLGAVALVFLFIFLGIGSMIKKALFPPAPPPATVAFGKIPRFDTSVGYSAPSGEKYILETVTGELPALATEAKVFKIEPGNSTFGEMAELKEIAQELRFTEGPFETSDGKLKFSDSENSDRIIIFDKLTGNFNLSSNYSVNPNIITSKPDSLEEAITTAQSFFEQFGISETEFPQDKIKTKFQRIDGNKLTETQSLSTANLIEVDFYRGNLDKLPVIWAKDDKVAVSALVSTEGIVAANLDLAPIKKSLFATYPLKDVKNAYEELKSGGGAFNRPVTASEILISDAGLGYVESAENTEYLSPVYLFRSPNGLIGYVPAVNELWVK